MTRLLAARTVAVVAGLLVLAAGCASVGAESFDTRGEVRVFDVDVPLREPTWVSEPGVLLALAEGEPRVVKLDPDEGDVVVGEELEDAGENLATYHREPGRVYLPQPEFGRIAVLEAEDLHVEETLEAGEAAPFEVATQLNSDTLFTLSRDGSTVTAFDLEEGRLLDEVEVGAGEGAMLEAFEKAPNPSFWVAERGGGVSFYHGDPTPIRRLTGEEIGVNDLAVDHESSQRA